MLYVDSPEILFCVKIVNCEYYFLTNIPCSKCLEKKYRCKINHFSAINKKDIKEWKLLSKGNLTGNCSCILNINDCTNIVK
jgi:hypothetical protein